MEKFLSVYETIGPAGLALVLAAFAGIYFAVKSFYFLYTVWREFKNSYSEIEECGFLQECMGKAEHNPLACIIRDIVQTHSRHSEDIRAEVAYLFHRNFEQVTREISYLRLISVMSPMLGLLGTIFGMVGVFQTIGQNSAPDTAMLATGIWEALITTIMGLCVAIPSLMLYYFLILRFKGFHIVAVEHSYRALESVKSSKGAYHGSDV